MLAILLAVIGLAALAYAAVLAKTAVSSRALPRAEAIVLGAVTNFFDTLGIGSFAPTMAWLRFRGLVADRQIPTTLVTGHTFPAMLQAMIFLHLLGVAIDPLLLIGCIVALLCGGLIGAPIAARARTWVVQAVVALALLLAAALFAMTNLNLLPAGGEASSLPPLQTVAAIIANLVFGILLNFGVGNYAPTLVMLSLMGLDPRLCFPIMAGGAAIAGAGAGMRHMKIGELDLRVVGGMALGGIPAVLIAAFIVEGLSIEVLRWFVVVVVVYAALAMVRSAWSGWRRARLPVQEGE